MFRWVESEGVRRKVFVSLGDPHNMLTLKNAGDSEGG